MIKPEDDRFHDRSDDPYWNESAWFGFQVPERSLTGFIYFYHRPNMNYSVGGVGFWDPSGQETYDCLYYDWGDTFATPAGADMFNFTLENGLTVAIDQPLKSFDFSYRGTDWYQGKGCELELRYEAFIEPHLTGNPPGQREWSQFEKGHFEQPGRIRGSVELAGETIEIDTWCERDHSWGRRALRTNARGHFPWAIASPTSAFHVWAMSDADPAVDPIAGTSERVAAGWYLKDGSYGTLTGGSCAVVERNEIGQPMRMEVNATDNLGRELYAEGRARNMLNWHGYPFMMMWWGQYEWTFDGQVAYGEEQDYLPLQQARQFLRTSRQRVVV
jgi:hypothetical protein